MKVNFSIERLENNNYIKVDDDIKLFKHILLSAKQGASPIVKRRGKNIILTPKNIGDFYFVFGFKTGFLTLDYYCAVLDIDPEKYRQHVLKSWQARYKTYSKKFNIIINIYEIKQIVETNHHTEYYQVSLF